MDGFTVPLECDLVICLDGGLVTMGVCKLVVVIVDDGFDSDVEPDAVEELKEDVGLLVLNEGTDVIVDETTDLVVDVLGIEVVTYSVTTVLFAVAILTVVEVVIPSEVYKRVVFLPSFSQPRS